jgi:hypothetical protein
MSKHLTVFMLILCWGGVGLFAYDIRLTAQVVDEGPVIDGYLTDEVWQQAALFTDFKMVLPQTGVAPSERTELRVLYDDKNLYIGAYCFSADPDAIVVTDLQHDQKGEGSDTIRILLDPFQDKRNAYVFFVNARGARTDGLAGGEHFSTNWDGIWQAKSRLVTDGWCCEIKIPFKTISFNPNLGEWGFNVERYIPRKNETIRLSGISKDSFFYNPAAAALLGGIKNIRQGKGLTLKPYVSLDMARDYENRQPREWKMNGGFDLYKHFTPNLVGVLTYHTDFAETEVDDRQFNLTRFPLYFPEKRSFFLEGSEIFSFGAGGGYHPSFEPFFSRRIGLYKGEPVPIDWGAKVYGKIGRTNVALLDVQTQTLNSVPAGNFAAGRIYHNIFAQSKVGLIFTSGQPGTNAVNTLLGIDFEYATSRLFKSKNFSAGGWWVHNWNAAAEGRHCGYGFRVEYPNDLLDFHFTYNYFGDALDPGLGFLSRGSVQQFESMFRIKPRPTKGLLGRWLRQISLMLYPNVHWDLGGSLESSRISVAPFTIFDSEWGDRFEVFFIFHREVLPKSFEVADGVVIPVDDYRYNRYQINLKSASHRKVAIDMEYEFGGFYGGRLSQLEVGVDLNFKGNVRLGLEGDFIRGNLPQGKFAETLYRAKADFYLTPDLGLMTYIQYDSLSENIGANFRFKWRMSPGNTIYLVYNKSWEKAYDPLSGYTSRRFLSLQDRGVFKIQLSWRP